MRLFSKDGPLEGEPVQDAFFEYLLCRKCEQSFQKWEDHAARIIYQKRLFDFAPTKHGELRQLDGLSYKRFKLFLLSVLWRMSVSSLPTFEQVRLGRHGDIIRRMLIEENPGEVTDYGSTIAVVHLADTRVNITRPADPIRFRSHRIYRALIDGLLVTWVVGSPTDMKNFDTPELLLQKNGHWLTRSRDIRTIRFIAHEFKTLMKE